MEKFAGMSFKDASAMAAFAHQQALLRSEIRRLSIQKWIQTLQHACQCKEICEIKECLKMKRIIWHIKSCKKRASEGCQICKQVVALCCYHSRHCRDTVCLVPFCHCIKKKLKMQQLQQRQQQRMMKMRQIQQAQLLRKSMAALSLDPEPSNAEQSMQTAPTQDP